LERRGHETKFQEKESVVTKVTFDDVNENKEY